MNANKPKPEQKDIQYQVIGDKMIGFYTEFDESGKAVIRQIQSESIPGLQQGDNIQVFDGVPYIIKKNDDGTVYGEKLPGFEEKPKDKKVETIGDVENGVYERQEDGTWKQVIAPQAETQKNIISDTLAEKLGIPFGSTIEEANKVIKQRQYEKAQKEIKDRDDAAILFDKKLEDVQEIIDSEGLNSSVGSRWYARLDYPILHYLNEANRSDFMASVEQLVDTQTL